MLANCRVRSFAPAKPRDMLVPFAADFATGVTEPDVSLDLAESDAYESLKELESSLSEDKRIFLAASAARFASSIVRA